MTQSHSTRPSPTAAEAPREREIASEQVIVDLAYSELDRQLAEARRSLAATEARGAAGTHQSRGERDAYAVHYTGLISSLEGVEDRLVFGRMDLSPRAVAAQGRAPGGPVTDAGRRHYVGRTGLQDAQHREVVLDWRAPLARAFYQATASDPMGLVRRRHIETRERLVLGVEDELVDVGGLDDLEAAPGAPEEGGRPERPESQPSSCQRPRACRARALSSRP